MKAKMNFGIVKTTILALIALVCVALIIVDILLLAGIFGDRANDVVAGVSLAAGAIMLGVCMWMLLGSFYEVKEDYFKAVLGPFRDKISYDSIDAVRQNTVTKEVFVAINDEKGSSVISLNLLGDKADKMAMELANKCGVLVEYYSPEKNEKK